MYMPSYPHNNGEMTRMQKDALEVRRHKRQAARQALGERVMDWLVTNPVTGWTGDRVFNAHERVSRIGDKLRKRNFAFAYWSFMDKLGEYQLAQFEGLPVGPGSNDFTVQVSSKTVDASELTVVSLHRSPENTKGGFQNIINLDIMLDPNNGISFLANGQPRTFARPNVVQHLNNATAAMEWAIRQSEPDPLLALYETEC